jgi:hypothetical protein
LLGVHDIKIGKINDERNLIFESRDKLKKDMREFENYPRLKEIVTKRIVNKEISPSMQESDYWWTLQNPVFYHHHFKHYRYTHRAKREVPWDGTYNMPTLPYTYLNDRTGFVHNGLLESVEPKPNGAW